MNPSPSENFKWKGRMEETPVSIFEMKNGGFMKTDSKWRKRSEWSWNRNGVEQSESDNTCEKNILMNRNHIKLNLQGSAKFWDHDSDSKKNT